MIRALQQPARQHTSPSARALAASGNNAKERCYRACAATTGCARRQSLPGSRARRRRQAHSTRRRREAGYPKGRSRAAHAQPRSTRTQPRKRSEGSWCRCGECRESANDHKRARPLSAHASTFTQCEEARLRLDSAQIVSEHDPAKNGYARGKLDTGASSRRRCRRGDWRDLQLAGCRSAI